MIKDFFKIADFLDKSGRTKDSNTIDYIAMKYAGGDLKDFFKRGMHKDYLDTEFGKKVARKKYGVVERETSLEEDETEELLKSLSARLAEE